MLKFHRHSFVADCIFTACNGTIVDSPEMGEVIQLQGDQRKDVQEFLTSEDGLGLKDNTIKVRITVLLSQSTPD